MSDYRDEIARVAASLNIPMNVFSEGEAKSLRDKVVTAYSKPNLTFMWDCVHDHVISIQLENRSIGWEWLKEYSESIQPYLLFDDYRNGSIFVFETWIEAISTLEECFRMEFYLTDQNATFLLCINHHDYLIAWGTAVEWLEKKIEGSL